MKLIKHFTVWVIAMIIVILLADAAGDLVVVMVNMHVRIFGKNDIPAGGSKNRGRRKE